MRKCFLGVIVLLFVCSVFNVSAMCKWLFCCCKPVAVEPHPESEIVDIQERCLCCQCVYIETGVTFLRCGHLLCSECARKLCRVRPTARTCPIDSCKQEATIVFRLSSDQLQANHGTSVSYYAVLIADIVAQGHAEALVRIDRFAPIHMINGTLNLSCLPRKLNDESFAMLLNLLVVTGVAPTITELVLTGNRLRIVPNILMRDNFPALINVRIDNDNYMKVMAVRFSRSRALHIDLSYPVQLAVVEHSSPALLRTSRSTSVVLSTDSSIGSKE